MFQLICVVSDDLNERVQHPGPTDLRTTREGRAVLKRLTEPIERKKPNVAALLSMY